MSSIFKSAASVVFVAAFGVLQFSSVAVADQRGNGGGGVVCRDASGKISSVKTLDVHEAEFREIALDFGPAETEPLKIVNFVLDRLKNMDPAASERYRARANQFFDPKMSRFKKGITLPFTEDTGPIALPNGCELEQIVLQLKPAVPEDRLFTVNEDLFVLLDAFNQAALILHEVVYEELLTIRNGGEPIHKNSFYARYYNEQILSARFATMAAAEYIFLFGGKMDGGSHVMRCDEHVASWNGIGLGICTSETGEEYGAHKIEVGRLPAEKKSFTFGDVQFDRGDHLGMLGIYPDAADKVAKIYLENIEGRTIKIQTKGNSLEYEPDGPAAFYFRDDKTLSQVVFRRGIWGAYNVMLDGKISLPVPVPVDVPLKLRFDVTGKLSRIDSGFGLLYRENCSQVLKATIVYNLNPALITAEAGRPCVAPVHPNGWLYSPAAFLTSFQMRPDYTPVSGVIGSADTFYVFLFDGNVVLTDKVTFSAASQVESGYLKTARNLTSADGHVYNYKAGVLLHFDAQGKVSSWDH